MVASRLGDAPRPVLSIESGLRGLTATRTGKTHRLLIGHMDPVEEPSGAWKRLEHLGYLAAPRANLPDAVAAAALKRFQKDSGLPLSGELDVDTLKALEREHGS